MEISPWQDKLFPRWNLIWQSQITVTFAHTHTHYTATRCNTIYICTAQLEKVLLFNCLQDQSSFLALQDQYFFAKSTFCELGSAPVRSEKLKMHDKFSAELILFILTPVSNWVSFSMSTRGKCHSWSQNDEYAMNTSFLWQQCVYQNADHPRWEIKTL